MSRGSLSEGSRHSDPGARCPVVAAPDGVVSVGRCLPDTHGHLSHDGSSFYGTSVSHELQRDIWDRLTCRLLKSERPASSQGPLRRDDPLYGARFQRDSLPVKHVSEEAPHAMGKHGKTPSRKQI